MRGHGTQRSYEQVMTAWMECIKGGLKALLLDHGDGGWKKASRTLLISSNWKNIEPKCALLINLK